MPLPPIEQYRLDAAERERVRQHNRHRERERARAAVEQLARDGGSISVAPNGSIESAELAQLDRAAVLEALAESPVTVSLRARAVTDDVAERIVADLERTKFGAAMILAPPGTRPQSNRGFIEKALRETFEDVRQCLEEHDPLPDIAGVASSMRATEDAAAATAEAQLEVAAQLEQDDFDAAREPEPETP